MDGTVIICEHRSEGRHFSSGYNVLGEVWQAEYDKKYASLHYGGDHYKKKIIQLKRHGKEPQVEDNKCQSCGKKPIEKFTCQCLGGVNDIRGQDTLELHRIDMTLEPGGCTKQRTGLQLPAYIIEKSEAEIQRMRCMYDDMLEQQRRKVFHQHDLTARGLNPPQKADPNIDHHRRRCTGLIHQQREEVASRRNYDFKEIRHHQRRCKAILQTSGIIPRDAYRRPIMNDKQRDELFLRRQRLDNERYLATLPSEGDSYRGLGSRRSSAFSRMLSGMSGKTDSPFLFDFLDKEGDTNALSDFQKLLESTNQRIKGLNYGDEGYDADYSIKERPNRSRDPDDVGNYSSESQISDIRMTQQEKKSGSGRRTYKGESEEFDVTGKGLGAKNKKKKKGNSTQRENSTLLSSDETATDSKNIEEQADNESQKPKTFLKYKKKKKSKEENKNSDLYKWNHQDEDEDELFDERFRRDYELDPLDSYMGRVSMNDLLGDIDPLNPGESLNTLNDSLQLEKNRTRKVHFEDEQIKLKNKISEYYKSRNDENKTGDESSVNGNSRRDAHGNLMEDFSNLHSCMNSHRAAYEQALALARTRKQPDDITEMQRQLTRNFSFSFFGVSPEAQGIGNRKKNKGKNPRKNIFGDVDMDEFY